MSDSAARIAKIRDLPFQLEQAVAGLSDAQLDTPYREGGWTVRQVVHHVADSHMNAFIRMKLMVTEEHPTIKPYNQDDWAVQADSRNVPLAPSLSIIRGLHDRWCRLLEHVKESEWARTAVHPERGTVTLDAMLSTYAAHGEKHVGHITSLRRQRNW
jgi:uncharacterized damage-inducible protein DinB